MTPAEVQVRRRRREFDPQPPTTAVVAEEPPPRAITKQAVALACLAFLVYNANFRTIGSGDSLPARFLPLAVLESGSLYLNSVSELVRGGHPNPYWMLATLDGRLASMYPIVTPLLVTPLYLPVAGATRLGETSRERLAMIGEIMEKLSAAMVASVAVGLMFVLLSRRVPGPHALLLTLLFAFGTNTWMTSSQALWQHGAAELFAILALAAVTRPPTWKRLALGGLATGLLVANRPFDVFLAAGFALFAIYWARWRSVVFLAFAAVPCGLVLAYNLQMFGIATGGYGVVRASIAKVVYLPAATGMAGLLISPARGLLVFAPFLAALLLLLARRYRDGKWRVLDSVLAASCIGQLIFLARFDWRAGYSFGPRFLTDMLPLLVWLVAPVVARMRRWETALLLVLGLWSVYVQAFGAFVYVGHSEPVINSSWEAPWRWGNAPFVFERRSGLAPPRLLQLGRQLALED